MSDPALLNQISISHGQVLWVIGTMNFVSWLDRSALDSVLKKFRLNKVPNFKRTGQQGRAGADFVYGYSELMDCVLAMKLVSDGLAFRHVLALMQFDVERLHKAYIRAYLEANESSGKEFRIEAADGRHTHISGLYLDFHANISELGVLTTRGPMLLDPWQALERYMGGYANFHPIGMVRLSQLATEAVRLALKAPAPKRGRKPSR